MAETIGQIQKAILETSFAQSREVEDFLINFDFSKRSVFTTGVGASQVPSQSLAHALASIGMKAHAVDPTELLHGGFGRLRPNDLLITFSHSGKTAEIRQTLAHCKKFGVITFLVTGSNEASLSGVSDHLIHYQIGKDGEAITGVPSTSLISQMLVSLGICKKIMVTWGGSLSELSHPSGSLSLDHKMVRDYMRPITNDKVCETSAPLRIAINKMSTNGMGAVIVSDGGSVRGVFTDGDLRRLMLKLNDSSRDILARKVIDFVEPNPKVVMANKSLQEALLVFEEGKKVLFAPVLNSQTLIGVIHIHDILNEAR